MDTYELRKYALDREHDRDVRIAAVTNGLPKRKGGELSNLVKIVAQAHKTLCDYDLQQSPPPIASTTETWFDLALERIEQIKTDIREQQNAAAAQANAATTEPDADEET